MTYQTIYSSESTLPMQSDDLEELLEHARNRNVVEGISGALIYTDGTFLQVLEGERTKVQALMASILKDRRHINVTILREGEIASAEFQSWGMAYVSATPEQAATWAGIGADTKKGDGRIDVDANLRRTAQFAHDILALRTSDTPAETRPHQDSRSEPGTT